MHDDDIIDLLADYDTPAEALNAFTYHGTGEDFQENLRPSGTDGCLWLAYNPAVAQTYIPSSDGQMLLGVRSFELDDPVRPEINCTPPQPDGIYALALQLGFPEATNPQFDRMGRAASYGTPPGYPTYRVMAEKLAAMGYPWEPGRDFRAWVRSDTVKGRPVFRPRDYRQEGCLFVVRGASDLRLFDFAGGREGDLTNVDYRRLNLFRRKEADGYDGIIIHDFCQTENHGNVGHLSIGVFARGLEKLDYAAAPASHWEWPVGGCCEVVLTPEFIRAHGQAVDVRLSSQVPAMSR